jgi:hypothetical protein
MSKRSSFPRGMCRAQRSFKCSAHALSAWTLTGRAVLSSRGQVLTLGKAGLRVSRPGRWVLMISLCLGEYGPGKKNVDSAYRSLRHSQVRPRHILKTHHTLHQEAIGRLSFHQNRGEHNQKLKAPVARTRTEEGFPGQCQTTSWYAVEGFY